jgi:hypothetical protein
MAKFDFKKAAVNHTEKVVFGILLLIVLYGLAGTDWVPYKGTPYEILAKVEALKKNMTPAAAPWPAEEKQKYVLTEARKPSNVVQNQLFAALNPGQFEPSMALFADRLAPKKPLTEIGKNAPEQLIATTARVLIEVWPPEDESASDDKALAMTAGAKEEEDPDLLDEFRQRKPGAGGAAGGLAGFGGEDTYYAPDAYEMPTPTMMTGPGTDMTAGSGYYGGPEGMGMGMAQQPKKNAKAYPFVSVRAIFKVQDQIRKFQEAMNVSYDIAARQFYIVDFELERRRRLAAPDQWAEWEPVDMKVAEDVLAETVGFDADTVSSVITDPVITMPLPMRVSGEWRNQATHPAIAKFQLTDEQIELELELNRRMIQTAIDQRMATRNTGVKRGGFYSAQFGAREVTANMLGMESMYGGSEYTMMGGGGPGIMGMSTPGMMGGGPATPGGRPGGRPPARGGKAEGETPQRLDQLLDQLVKKGEPDEKEVREKLKTWLQTRAKAEGELLLFRFLDFSVTPGETYQYRVRFVLPNPNFGRRVADAGGDHTVVEGETRKTPWSNLSDVVTVQPDVEYYLTEVRPAPYSTPSRIFPTATWDVYQFDHTYGTTMKEKLELRLGQKIGDTVKTDVIKPAENFYDKEDYTFKSDDFVVDMLGDIELDPKFHQEADPTTAVKTPQGGRGFILAQGQSLVMTARGEEIFDGFTQSSMKKKVEDYYKQQITAYQKMKEMKDKLAQAGAGGGEYPYGGEEMLAGMDDMYGMMGGGPRQRNVLRKSSKANQSSTSGARPGASGPGAIGPGGRPGGRGGSSYAP